MHRHGDADLLSVITNTVPPLDLAKVAIFQVHLAKYNSEVLLGDLRPYQILSSFDPYELQNSLNLDNLWSMFPGYYPKGSPTRVRLVLSQASWLSLTCIIARPRESTIKLCV